MDKKLPAKGTAEVVDRSFTAEELTTRFTKWFPKLSAKTIERLGAFYLELIKSNSNLNLISASTIRAADVLHIADCVLASQLVLAEALPNFPIYDLASGGGLPGIVLAILDDSKPIVLVDKDPRRAHFLRNSATLLGLNHVKIEVIDIEKLPPNSIRNAVCRDFVQLGKAMLLLRKQMTVGGKLFHFKSDGWSQELVSVPTQLFSIWEASLLGQYALPETGSEMAVVLSQKKSD